METTPSNLIFIDTSAPSLDGLFLETTPASDSFFQTTPESDYLYIDTSPPSGKFSDHVIMILVISYLDSLYEMITTPVPLASLVEDTPPNFLTEVENVSFAFSSKRLKCIFQTRISFTTKPPNSSLAEKLKLCEKESSLSLLCTMLARPSPFTPISQDQGQKSGQLGSPLPKPSSGLAAFLYESYSICLLYTSDAADE